MVCSRCLSETHHCNNHMCPLIKSYVPKKLQGPGYIDHEARKYHEERFVNQMRNDAKMDVDEGKPPSIMKPPAYSYSQVASISAPAPAPKPRTPVTRSSTQAAKPRTPPPPPMRREPDTNFKKEFKSLQLGMRT